MRKIHHKGIATDNLESLKEEYIKLGYSCINEVYDEIQKAYLCLLENSSECIELIYTDDEDSCVYNICKDNYKKEYHVCYIVESLEDEIKELKKQGCILIRDICYAKLLNANICFLYTRNREVIELVEYNE